MPTALLRPFAAIAQWKTHPSNQTDGVDAGSNPARGTSPWPALRRPSKASVMVRVRPPLGVFSGW
jgi:hypothetical protein